MIRFLLVCFLCVVCCRASVQVYTGRFTSCTIQRDTNVYCWGIDGYGIMGGGINDEYHALPLLLQDTGGAVSGSISGHMHCIVALGAVLCTGTTTTGEFGDGVASLARGRFTVIPGLESGADYVFGCGGSFCAHMLDARFICWGFDDSGKLGRELGPGNDDTTPAEISGSTSLLAVALSGYAMCVVTSGGFVQCVGSNVDGVLGAGGAPSEITYFFSGVDTLQDVRDISGNVKTMCAITLGDTVWCWGSNEDGMLGVGVGDDVLSVAYLPMQVVTRGVVNAVSAGATTTCLLYPDRTMDCAGRNDFYQLGYYPYDNTDPQAEAVPFADGVQPIIKIYTGTNNVLALMQDERVMYSGVSPVYHFQGQGPAGLTPFFVPQLPRIPAPTASPVPTPLTVELEVYTASYTSCALQRNTQVFCWGLDTYGIMGNGLDDGGIVYFPTLMANSLGTTSAYMSYNVFCVIIAEAVLCTGKTEFGQFGDGVEEQTFGALTLIPELESGVSSMHGGFFSNCVRMNDGQYECWGKNDQGQLMRGNTNSGATVETANTPAGTIQLAMLDGATCALLNVGSVSCIGSNQFGLLGTGASLSDSTLAFVDIPQTWDAVSISGNFLVACVLTLEQEVYCWGNNVDGATGIGNFKPDYVTVPTLAIARMPVVKVVTGSLSTCMIYVDNTMDCAGVNAAGQLGFYPYDSFSSQAVAVSFAQGLVDIESVSVGYASVVALLGDGTVVYAGFDLGAGEPGVEPNVVPDLPREYAPTNSPTEPTASSSPTPPTAMPSFTPTYSPQLPTHQPSRAPIVPVFSDSPTSASPSSKSPTSAPSSSEPTGSPSTLVPVTTIAPTKLPTKTPTTPEPVATAAPMVMTVAPTMAPTAQPIVTQSPTLGACGAPGDRVITVENITFCCESGFVQPLQFTPATECNLKVETLNVAFGIYAAFIGVLIVAMVMAAVFWGVWLAALGIVPLAGVGIAYFVLLMTVGAANWATIALFAVWSGMFLGVFALLNVGPVRIGFVSQGPNKGCGVLVTQCVVYAIFVAALFMPPAYYVAAPGDLATPTCVMFWMWSGVFVLAFLFELHAGLARDASFVALVGFLFAIVAITATVGVALAEPPWVVQVYVGVLMVIGTAGLVAMAIPGKGGG